MAEQSANSDQGKPKSRSSFSYEILVLIILLIAVIAIYTLIFRQSFIPTVPLSPTFTETELPTAETSLPDTLLNETPSLQTTLTLTQSSETLPTDTPLLTQTPEATTPPGPSLTPAFGSCQYTLKAGPRDYLYAIYWNWHINKAIPVVNDFYARITCAPLLSNIGCTYNAAKPGKTQPGWILILPGVSPNICLHYGGIPAP
jgi:hypothetical protein